MAAGAPRDVLIGSEKLGIVLDKTRDGAPALISKCTPNCVELGADGQPLPKPTIVPGSLLLAVGGESVAELAVAAATAVLKRHPERPLIG